VKLLDDHRIGLEVSDPEDDDGVDLKLEDEPRVLLDYLNARRRKVAKSLF